jgi:hypothetical protein
MRTTIPAFKLDVFMNSNFYFSFLCLTVLLVCSAGAQTTLVSSDFRGSTASDWTFVNGQGDGPALTAATGVDAEDEGWLRLTKDAGNQSSFVYNNNAIQTSHGLVFTFDLVIWGARSSLADGVTLAIFDANVTPSAGGYGGSLGYAQRFGIEGLAGGIVGFGFDTFGNFSDDGEGREGGPGRTANSVAIRGSMGADRNSGYEYITGTGSLNTFSTPSAASRDDASIHTIRITIPTDRRVSVEWMAEGEEWETLIDDFECTLTCPEEVRFGFTAGTGASYSNQEIRNLSVSSVETIPEPSSVLMVSVVLAAGFWIRRRFVD